MGKLVFRVASDWQEVVRLRTEIEKLKQTLLSMDSTQSPDTFKKLNIQLGESTKKMNILISGAAKAGATMENDFKKGIYDGEKAVNSLSEEIIKQKNIIRETQNDVSMLTEQYKKLGKYDPKRQSLSDELNHAKAALGEQKYALGELQSQQALVRLSTKALKDEYALFKDESKAVITVNEGVGVSFKKTLAAIGGIAMLKQVASNVVSTAGMFQKYESVLTNALNGSSEKAKTYLSDINSFAAKTNFQLDELTDDFIKFVNRGVTPSMDAMKKMGDFTNTVAKPFDQLTEAILDINNPERWKEFGVRVQTEGNKVKLSFRGMTVECDRTVESVMKAVEQFGSMKGVEGSTEAIAKTIEGQMSNLEDTITTALAEIGLANQGLISGSISAVDTIVKNYDIIGKSVLALIEIYGVYRAGLLINTIVEQGSVKSIWAKITATKAATVAQAAYNKVLAMNPYVAVGMAVVSLGVAVYTLADHTTYAEKTTRSAAESMEKMKNASDSLKNKINELLSVIRDETSTQYKKADAYLKLQGILPEVFKNMDIEKIKLMDKLSLLEKINEASDRREIVGAKTNVVLAQKEVDKINALIAADSKRGTYSGQYEVQLSDAKSKLEAAKKVVADIEKIQIEANKQKEKDDKKVVIKNKEFWSNQKKEAETALDAIASSQKKLMDAGNFKGVDAAVVKSYKDNIKKLKEAENELKVYDSSSKQENQAEKLRKQTDKYNALLDKQSLEQQRSAEDLQMKVDEARVKAMDEGSAKTIAEMELNFEKEMQAIDRQKEDALRKKIEDARTAWESNPDNKGKSFDATGIKLSDKEQKYYDELYKIAIATNDNAYKQLSDKYRSYTDERLEIEKNFNDDIALLQEARNKAAMKGDADEIAKIDRSIAKATAEKGKSLMKHDFDVMKQSSEYIRAFEDLKNTSSETLNSLLNQFENAKQVAAETLNPEDLREYTTTIQEIMDELDARNPFKALADRQKELAEAEKELAEVKRQLDAVNRGERVVTGVKTLLGEDGKIKIENTYLSAADALNKYNAAKDKHQRANNNFIKAEKTAREKVDELAFAIKEIGDAIGGQAGEIISLMGDVALFATGTIDGITKVTQTGANAISAVEKASVILGIISTAIQLLQKISELGSNKAFKQYEAYAEKVKEINALTDAVNDYRIAALEAQQAEANWFSTDNLKNLRDYKALHDEVAKAYADKAMESQAIYQNQSGGGWLTGAFNWVMGNLSALSWWDKWKNIWGQGDYEKGMTAAVNNLRIETRKKSSGFLGTGIGGKSQKTEDLVAWARNQGLGELFDDEGMINKELAQSLINNYGNKLVGQTKETLESLIELREQYDEYLNQLHEYVSSLYEPLVDNFVDSLWDWLDNGKDALDSFKDYASSTFRDIVSDMMRTIVLDKVVGTFSDDIAALYEEYAKGAIDETELMKKISERTSGLIDNYQQNIPTLQNIMDEINGYLQDAGIDLKKSESTSQQKATAGGFETMSQDTATELNGRFAALQIAGEEIKNQSITQSESLNLLTMKADTLLSIGSETRNIADEARDIMARSYLELVQISENTGISAKYLKDIKTDIAEVKKNTSKL